MSEGTSITTDDRQDLITVLDMRFGRIPPEVYRAIESLNDFSQIDHLILVAANASGWAEFLAEVTEPGFRIVGQAFDPLAKSLSEAAKEGIADE